MKKAAGWVCYYNLERPHYGEGMEGEPPFRALRKLGYDLPQEFALFLALVLDQISANWALRGGNDLLAHYKTMFTREKPSVYTWDDEGLEGGYGG